MSKLLALVYNYKGNIPPLGIAYISSYIKKNVPGWDVKIICNRFNPELIDAIVDCKPDIVGFYTLTPGFNKQIKIPAKKLLERIKVPFVLGGPHISSLPKKMPSIFDLGVIGEAEETLKEILECHDKGISFNSPEMSDVAGIVYRNKEDELVVTAKRARIKSLDDLPLPDYDQLNIEGYHPKRHREMPTKVLRAASVTTSRGCPFSCSFCQESGEAATYFGVDRFIEECNELVEKHNVNFIDIMDDLFIFNRKRLRIMAEEVEKSGLNKKVRFFGYVRADHLTEENVKLLKRMNFESVFIGFESASPRILSFLKNKKSDGSENIRAIELCHKYDILVYGSFIFGSPEETLEDMNMTRDFIRKYPMALIEWQILTPLPGTGVWNIAIEKKIIDENIIDYDNLLLRDTFDPKKPWLCDKMTKVDFDIYYQNQLKPLFWAQSQRANHFKWADLLNPSLWLMIVKEPQFYASVLKQTLSYKKEHGFIDVKAGV